MKKQDVIDKKYTYDDGTIIMRTILCSSCGGDHKYLNKARVDQFTNWQGNKVHCAICKAHVSPSDWYAHISMLYVASLSGVDINIYGEKYDAEKIRLGK